MYCTVKEIIRDVLDTDVPDSECVFAVVLTRGDVRHIAQDWSLTDDELETVMQRLDDAFVYGACDRVVSDTLPVCDVSDSGVFLSYVMELFLMLSLLDVISFILIARMLFNIHKIT